jgi:UDP-N-acetylmuramate dehydrogenase
VNAVARDLPAALEERLRGLELERGASLARRTTFGIGGPADLLVTAKSADDVVRVLRATDELGAPLFILGGGSNLLVADEGIRGVTLVLSGELATLTILDEGRTLEVGCGVSYPRLTRTALDLGWQPAIGWMGTPGQVGGALKMNAGTRDGEIGDVVVEVRAATLDGVRTLPRAACGFGYRTSGFLPRWVLTSTRLECDSHRTLEVEKLDAMAKELLARRHATQPKFRSAGSIFKNPPGGYAGRLIEQCGLKGRTEGRAQISPVHANFIVNLGGATARDVVALAEEARSAVKARFAIELEWEVRRVGGAA